MTEPFYNDNAPMPFQGIVEEEPEAPSRETPRRVLFTAGLMGPMGYMGGSIYPFIMGPIEEYYAEEETDPNP